MKKSFLFIAALFAAIAMNAQTIEIDGANADWAEVPMLSDPGATPIFKMVVPQAGLTLPSGSALCVMVERTAAEKAEIPGFPIVYVDADKDATTTAAQNAWYCPAFGPDYEMGAWDGNEGAANSAETIHEMNIVQSNFATPAFTGEVNAWMLFLLKDDWTEYQYLPKTPLDQSWIWGEEDFHPIIVKPYTFADLNGTHIAAGIYSSHEALPIGSVLNMGDADNGNDTKLWASWTVELKNPAKYTITANITSTNAASVDLKLVNMATNAVVATFTSEELAGGSDVAVGEWDLSAVPAGKYMLRFSNHVEYSAMKLSSITLAAQGSTAIDNANTAVKATKIVRDGQVLIQRDGKTFNAVGTEMK